MNTCIVCQTKFDVKDSKRKFGDMHWIGNQCSAQCHTKYVRALGFMIEFTMQMIPGIHDSMASELAKEKLIEFFKVIK